MSKANKSFKKTVRLEVIARLENTLGDLEQRLGKSKFRRRIKKASKLLTADLKKLKPISDAAPAPAEQSEAYSEAAS